MRIGSFSCKCLQLIHFRQQLRHCLLGVNSFRDVQPGGNLEIFHFLIGDGMPDNDFQADVVHANLVRQRGEGVAAVVGQMLQPELIHDGVPVCVLVGLIGIVISKFIVDQIFFVRIVSVPDQWKHLVTERDQTVVSVVGFQTADHVPLIEVYILCKYFQQLCRAHAGINVYQDDINIIYDVQVFPEQVDFFVRETRVDGSRVLCVLKGQILCQILFDKIVCDSVSVNTLQDSTHVPDGRLALMVAGIQAVLQVGCPDVDDLHLVDRSKMAKRDLVIPPGFVRELFLQGLFVDLPLCI